MKKSPHDHSNSNSNIIDGTQYSYVNIEEILLSCTKVLNIETGIEVELLPSDKVLYSFMRKRYTFFLGIDSEREDKYKKGEKAYFPDQKDLAEDLGVGISTIKRSLKKLQDVNLVQGEISGRSNFYKVNPIKPGVFTFYRKYKGKLVTFENWKKLTLKVDEVKPVVIQADNASNPQTVNAVSSDNRGNVDDIDDPFPVRGTSIASDPVTPAAKVDEVSVKQTQNNSYGDGYPNYPDYYYSPGSYHRDDESDIYSVIHNYSSHGRSTTKSIVQPTIACEYEEDLPF